MLSNNLIQETLIKLLQADTSVVGMLSSSGEIKEDNWQGVQFSYPAVRVDIQSQRPEVTGEECTYTLVAFSILCYSEEKSSKEANDLAWKVLQVLWNKSFSSNGMYFSLVRSLGLNPAQRKDDKTWVAEVMLESRVQLS